jgi:hypothetical protein
MARNCVAAILSVLTLSGCVSQACPDIPPTGKRVYGCRFLDTQYGLPPFEAQDTLCRWAPKEVINEDQDGNITYRYGCI